MYQTIQQKEFYQQNMEMDNRADSILVKISKSDEKEL